MDSVVVDSSVVIKWFVQETGSEKARRILHRYRDGALAFLAPDLLYAEVGNILWKKSRTQALERADAEAVFSTLQTIEFKIVPAAALLEDAFQLAADHDRTVYDSLYVALSLRENVDFITADERLVHAVQEKLPNVIGLGDWQPPAVKDGDKPRQD